MHLPSTDIVPKRIHHYGLLLREGQLLRVSWDMALKFGPLSRNRPSLDMATGVEAFPYPRHLLAPHQAAQDRKV